MGCQNRCPLFISQVNICLCSCLKLEQTVHDLVVDLLLLLLLSILFCFRKWDNRRLFLTWPAFWFVNSQCPVPSQLESPLAAVLTAIVAPSFCSFVHLHIYEYLLIMMVHSLNFDGVFFLAKNHWIISEAAKLPIHRWKFYKCDETCVV